MNSLIVRCGWLLCSLAFGGCADVVVDVNEWQLESVGTTQPVVLPAKLNPLVVEGTPYALSTTVTLPPSMVGKELVLSVPSMHGLVRLKLDDGVLAEPVDALPVLYRETGPHEWPIAATVTASGQIHLRLLVDHRWRMSAWWFSPPRLSVGAHEPMALLSWGFNRLGAAFMFMALVELCIIYMAVFLMDRRRKTYFWFALQAIAGCSYAFLVSGALQGVLGAYDAPFSAAGVCVALLASLYFFHSYFRLDSPPRALVACAVVCSIGCVATLHPLAWQPVWSSLTVGLLVVVVIYNLVGCARLGLRPKPPSGVVLVAASWTILGVGGGADALAWLGVVDVFEGARGACPALAIFGLLQSLLLSREHVATLKEGDRLNVELQAQVVALQDGRTQLDRLNDELQRQVLDRSRQLFAALALVGRGAIVPVLKDGDVVQDRYRVVRQVGVGGMGAVYEVVRINDGRRFAMKLATKVEGQGLARLAREAEFAASLRHDNIVGIIDVDVASAGYLFLVMEFIDGQTLGELLEAEVSAHEGLSLLADICAGLAALHAVGIVHRDVKPTNIMIEATGLEGGPAKRARLMDFGISRLAGPVDAVTDTSTSMGQTSRSPSMSTTMTSLHRPGATTTKYVADQVAAADDGANDGSGDDVALAKNRDATIPMSTRRDVGKADHNSKLRLPGLASHAPTPGSAPLTEFGHVIGTPMYMAPELGLGGTAVTPSADVFAVGVIAHEILAGALPYLEAPALCVLRGEAVPTPLGLAAARPGLPMAVVTVIDRCLLEDPSRRPSAAEVAELLGTAATALRHEATRPASTGGGVP